MESDQVRSWAWLRRRQPLHELERRHHEVSSPVAPEGLQLEHHLPDSVGLQALISQRGPGDVAS